MSRKVILGAVLAAAIAVPAIAQYGGGYPPPPPPGRGPMGGPPRAILFSGPGFQGRRLVVDRPIGKLERYGFDDKATSIMIKGPGAWQVCEDDHFGGRCEIIDRPIPDLVMIRMNNKISSIGPVGPGPGGPPPPRGY